MTPRTRSSDLLDRLVGPILDLLNLPYFPPCKGGRIIFQAFGFENGQATDTVAWLCPDGQVITKKGPAVSDKFGRPFPDTPQFLTRQEISAMPCAIPTDFSSDPGIRTSRRARYLLPKANHRLGTLTGVSGETSFQAQMIENSDGSIRFVGSRLECHTDTPELISLTAEPIGFDGGGLDAILGHLTSPLDGCLNRFTLTPDDSKEKDAGAVQFRVFTNYDPASGEPVGATIRVKGAKGDATFFISDFAEGFTLIEILAVVVVIVVAVFAVVATVAIVKGVGFKAKSEVDLTKGKADTCVKVTPGSRPR